MTKFAAVDIGSNSMRLLVAEASGNGGFVHLAEDRQVTRLGESVFTKGALSEEAIGLAEGVLRKYRATIDGLGGAVTRAVATSATRDASNREDFMRRAQAALGGTIEIISGVEEARLIGLGVEAVWPQGNAPVLIVDVGGGSAEFVVMQGGAMVEGYSRPLGAVRLKEVFLEKDPPKREQILRLEEFINEKLELVVRRLGEQKFARALATSASAAAIVCAVNGIDRSERARANQQRATVGQVRELYRTLVEMPMERRRKVVGIGPRRAEIILGGVAVFLRTMERFGIEELYYSNAGVREGIVADLASRGDRAHAGAMAEEQRLVVEAFARRFGVGMEHARATAAVGLELFERLRGLHGLDNGYGRLLEAACYLMDVGHYLSDTSHHKHSHYLVRHADLPGFTEDEKELIALLCRFHRKSMPAGRHGEVAGLTPARRRALEMLAPIVRVADALDRSRDQHVRLVGVEMVGDVVRLKVEASGGRDTRLEEWAVERVGGAFRGVYGMGLVVGKSAVQGL